MFVIQTFQVHITTGDWETWFLAELSLNEWMEEKNHSLIWNIHMAIPCEVGIMQVLPYIFMKEMDIKKPSQK